MSDNSSLGKFRFGDKWCRGNSWHPFSDPSTRPEGDFGIVVQSPPVYKYPARDVTTTHIPGRNGDIIKDNGCYKNVTREYTIALLYKNQNGYYSECEKILEWLNSYNGKYVELEDTYDKEVIRLASYVQDGNFADYFGEAGAASIAFNCKPQRYLKDTYENFQTVLNDGFGNFIINNPTKYEAEPIYVIDGINTDIDTVYMMSISTNNNIYKSITISGYNSSFGYGNLYIDSETGIIKETKHDVNVGDSIYLNGKGLPKLLGGENRISFRKYKKHIISNIPSYENVIDDYLAEHADEKWVCHSDHVTYGMLEDKLQKSHLVKAFASLIDAVSEKYDAESYESNLKANSYDCDFEEINDFVNNSSVTLDITGDANFIESNAPTDSDGIPYIKVTDRTEDNCIIRANKHMFARVVIRSETTETWSQNFVFYAKNDAMSYRVGINDNIMIQMIPAKLYWDRAHQNNYDSYIRENYSAIQDYTNAGICNFGLSNDSAKIDIDYYKGSIANLKIYDDNGTSHTPTNGALIYVIADLNYGNPDVNGIYTQKVYSERYSSKPDGSQGSLIYISAIRLVKGYDGWIWFDKEGLFGKAQWKYTEGWFKKKEKNQEEAQLVTFDWDSLSYKFKNSNKSSTSSMLFKRLGNPDDNIVYSPSTGIPQYSPIMEEIDGVSKIKTPVNFEIRNESSDNSFSQISVIAKNTGYYRSSIGKNQKTVWLQKNAGEAIFNRKLKSTEYFSVDYVKNENLLDYKSIDEDWPTWLDSRAYIIKDNVYVYATPENIVISGSTFNPIYLRNTMDQDMYYRISKEGKDEHDRDRYVAIPQNGYIIPADSDGKSIRKYANDAYYVYMIASIPELPVNDRIYWDGTTLYDNYSITPDYLGLDIDDDSEEISYVAKLPGYYRWGDNKTWIRIDSSGSLITKTGISDNIIIYYIDNMPDQEYYKSKISFADTFEEKAFDINIMFVSNNPDKVNFINTVSDGVYYMANSNTNWEPYNMSDIVLESKPSEVNTLYILEEIKTDLSQITLDIKPRWWYL